MTGVTRTPDPVTAPPGDMVWIPGGEFLMGSDCHYPEEAPAHRVRVDGFWIDRAPVTNEDFREFASATGYVTLAERPANAHDYPGAKPEMLVASSCVFQNPGRRVDLRNHYNWWAYVAGADWRHPQGRESSLKGRWKHPVVHVAYEDVEAYARWAGKEIGTEAEWEYAARGGLDGAAYAWGDDFAPGGRQMANTWQGEFPWQNLRVDGYEGTSPVGSFAANGYGLVDMIGNVWEWTADWFRSHADIGETCCTLENPRGGERSASFDPEMPGVHVPRKVMKGGSHLCAPNYCRRYRPAARMPEPVDTSASHLGFRCVVRQSLPMRPGF